MDSLYIIISSVLSIVIFALYIKNKFIYSVERIEGPTSHYSKNGTTSGVGIIFFIVPSLLYLIFNYSLENLMFIILISPFALIGFIDDRLKIKKKTEGLSIKIKMLLLMVASMIALIILYLVFDKTCLSFPLYFLFTYFLLISYTNACNFTDGIDGLLFYTSSPIFIYFMILSYHECFFLFQFLSLFMASFLIFGLYNLPKAKCFMGDCGSLMIGALMVISAIILKKIDDLIILSALIILEAISVLSQILYFKISKGKRIFKMAPYHHHLEFLGYSEKSIGIIFILIEAVLFLLILIKAGGAL